MKHYAGTVLLNNDSKNMEETKSSNSKALPPTNFHDHLVSEGVV